MASSSGGGSSAELTHLGSSSTGEPPAWSSKVISKARGLHKKSREIQQRFSLAETEQVVQTYYCSLHRELINHGGNMWITQNYVLFYSGFPFHHSEKISFRNMLRIERTKNSAGLSNCIEIAVEEGKLGERTVVFGAFLKTQETLTILNFLRHNPPSYIQLDDEEVFNAAAYSATSTAPNPYSAAGPLGGAGDGWGSSYGTEAGHDDGGWGSQTEQQRCKVDVGRSAMALRTALETREMGVAVMSELSRQAEVIDGINYEVEKIHWNLDKGDRILRGLETFGGGLKNTFTRDNTRKNNIVFQRMERSLHLKGKVPDIVDVTILRKHTDDSLTPQVLRFHPEHFEIFDWEKQAVIKPLSWTYRSIEEIIMRARPLHMDIRFGKEILRFRMMTSACQAITNELFLRCVSHRHEPEVIFEPNIPPFDYGSYKLALVPAKKTDTDTPTNIYTAGNSQLIKAAKASDILGKDADEKIKADFDLQASHIDSILEVAGDLQSLAGAMGDEIDRSAQDLDSLGVRTGEAVHRVHHSNFRVKKML